MRTTTISFQNEGRTEDKIEFINSKLTTNSSNIPVDVTYATCQNNN